MSRNPVRPVNTMSLSTFFSGNIPDLRPPKDLKFLRCVFGNTLGSDEGFIGKLKEHELSLKEVSNVEECEVILGFCPVVSRAGTDIEAAVLKLQGLSVSKPAVVVVLHHTYDPEFIVPDSSRSVIREKTLTVDCVFHEDKGLLPCQRNQKALDTVIEWTKPQIQKLNEPQSIPKSWFSNLFGSMPELNIPVNTHKHNNVLKNILSEIKHAHTINQSLLENPQGKDLSKSLSKIEKQLENLLKEDETSGKELQDKSTQMPELMEEDISVPCSSDLRLVLLGRDGSGKRAAMNTILGINDSEAGPSATVQKDKKTHRCVKGKHLLVFDTPDKLQSEFSQEDIRRCICVSAPGPHAFLIVVPVKGSTGEERGILENMEKLFGEKCWRNTIVLLTVTDEHQKSNIEEFLRSGDQEVQKLVEKCGNRFHCLNTEETGDGSQVSELLRKIEKMLEGNTEKFYSSDIYWQIREMEKRVMDTVLIKIKEDILAYETVVKKIENLQKNDIKYENMEEVLEDIKRKTETIKRKGDELAERYRLDIKQMKETYDGEGWTEVEKGLMKIILPEVHFMLWDSKMQFRRQVELKGKQVEPQNHNPVELTEDTSKTEEIHQKTLSTRKLLDPEGEKDGAEHLDDSIPSEEPPTVNANENQGPNTKPS